MAVSFIPQNSNKDRLNIDIVAHFRGRRYKKTAGIAAPKERWMQATQKCSESIDRFPEGIDYNRSLKKQKEAAEKAIAHFIGEMTAPTQAEFWNKVDELIHGEVVSVGGFTAYFEGYSYLYVMSKRCLCACD